MSLAGDRLRRRSDVFGRKIIGRSHDAAGTRIAGVLDPQKASQPQVRYFCLSVGRDQQVAGLHVAMHHSSAVSVGQAAGRLRDDRGGVLHRQFSARPHQFAQVGAGHELGYQEIYVAVVPGIEGAHEVFVIEAGPGRESRA